MAEFIRPAAPTRRSVRYQMPRSITEIEMEARRAGMSYGAYVAQLNAVAVIHRPTETKGKRRPI